MPRSGILALHGVKLNFEKNKWFYNDGQEYKVNSNYDLFRQIHHNFSLSFKICS